MQEKFEPTHVMTVGEGKKKSRYKVRAIGPIGEGEILHYNVIFSPRSKLYREGIHFVCGVPARSLKEIKG